MFEREAVCTSTAVGVKPDAATRARWLKIAENLKPLLHERRVSPLGEVQIHPNSAAFQKWEAVSTHSMEEVYGRSMGRGTSVILDFGEHIVGYPELTVTSVGMVDAPLRLELIFGETEAEVSEAFDPYDGVLGRGWLQDETITVDHLPIRIELSRRYAFRYLKIRVVDTSVEYTIRVADVSCRTVSSALPEAAQPCPDYLDKEIREIDIVSLRTLANCMQTVFEDGPKRDRRLWIGDLRLQALVNYKSFNNLNLVKRCLYYFAALSNDDGTVTACIFETPEPTRGHSNIVDYAALFVPTVLEYVQASGDLETGADLWLFVKQQLDLLETFLNEDCLFVDPGNYWIFVDWNERLRKETSLQGIVIHAFSSGARLASCLGHDEEAESLEERAMELRAAARVHLFCRDLGVFASGLERQVSCASQIWMVLADVIKGQEAASLLRSVWSDPKSLKPASPYLYHYAVEAFIKAGLDEEAAVLLRNYWGRMISYGATTFWEVFDSEDPFLSPYKNYLANSYCHAWSCTPAYFIRSYPEIFSKKNFKAGVSRDIHGVLSLSSI